MNEQYISKDLSTNSDAGVASVDASDASDNPATERPRHDTFIRKAFENPMVAKEFFEMHLPKEIKAMFSYSSLKMEKSQSYNLCKLKKSR